jgi:ABC-type antimicrobial peptide transport system permease subunit
MLLKNPGYTIIAVITLALGIGANSAIFSVVNAVLLRSLPYRDPDRLVMLSYYRAREGARLDTGRDFLDWRDQAKAFEQIAAYRFSTADLTGGGVSNMAATIRNQVRAIEPNEPVNQVVTMDEHLSNSVAGRRFQMLLLGVFAGVALVIAMVGIYGVISYAVSGRTREIGIRMALGAQASDVLRMVIWQGMSLALIGVAVGLAVALALTRVMKNLLFEVSATDPATFALIAMLLVVVALIASYIPARRATKVDPLVALRNE